MEDFQENGSLVPFADFGNVTFTRAEATTSSGSKVGPSGAVIIDLEQSKKVLTSVSTSSATVSINYI